MGEHIPSGNFSLAEIIEAVEIMQKANMIDRAIKECDAAGFRMQFADATHGIKISEVLNAAIIEIRKTEPDYYKDPPDVDPHIYIGGPCPCRSRRKLR